MNIIDKLIKELSYKTKEGYIDFNKETHIELLRRELLEGYNIPVEIVNETVNNILGEATILKSGYGHGSEFQLKKTFDKYKMKMVDFLGRVIVLN